MFPLERQLVVVCFGTPAIAGDSLGPEVGTILREDKNFPALCTALSTAPSRAGI